MHLPTNFWLCGILLIRLSAATICSCHTATIYEADSDCKNTTACRLVFSTRVPPSVPECPVTPTITVPTCASVGCTTSYITVVTPIEDCTYQSTPPESHPPQTSQTPRPPTSGTKSSGPARTSTTAERPTPSIPDDRCIPLVEYPNYYSVPLDNRNQFLEATVISNIAEQNSILPPVGYTQAFKNLHGRVASSKLRRLADITTEDYEPFDCASRCDSIPGCISFDIFFERLPTLTPGEFCPNPRATVRTGCTFWDGRIDGTMATYVGERQENFYVAVAGANGYRKSEFKPTPKLPVPATTNTTIVYISVTSTSTVFASTTLTSTILTSITATSTIPTTTTSTKVILTSTTATSTIPTWTTFTSVVSILTTATSTISVRVTSTSVIITTTTSTSTRKSTASPTSTVSYGLNARCSNNWGADCICLDSDVCINKYGGQPYTGFNGNYPCPGEKAEIMACVIKPCPTLGKGQCLWKSKCSSWYTAQVCPGGDDYVCCTHDYNTAGAGRWALIE